MAVSSPPLLLTSAPGLRMETPARLPRLLIVDESRTVRTLLARHTRERFEIREESDGESAWQVLVLDPTILLVISSLSLPVLDGTGLLQRLRSSKLARLVRMPMLMISGDSDQALERARELGASDFISRRAGSSEWLVRIESLIMLAHTQNQLKENLEQNVQNPETGLFTRKYVDLQAAQGFSHARRNNSELSAVVIGFDKVGTLREQHGDEVVRQLQLRLTNLLTSKLRKEDSLGHFAGSQFVVVSPGTTCTACESFGARLREAIHVASIAVSGQRLNLTVSVGIANIPTDSVTSPNALLELAGSRLAEAERQGGNRLVSCSPAPPSAASVPRLDLAIALIRAGHGSEVEPHLAALGREVLPLLKLLGRQFESDSLVDEIEQSLAHGAPLDGEERPGT